MKYESEIFIYITYIIFVFLKRIYDLYISLKYPTEINVKSGFGFDLIKFRKILAYFSLSWLLYMLFFFQLNRNMILLLYIILASILYYLLFEEDFIYYFIDKSKTNKKLMRYLDQQGAIIVNIVFFILYFYLVYKLVPPNFYKVYI
jgi:hypothetical protein